MVTQSSAFLTTSTTLRTAKSGLQKMVEDLCETAEIAMARVWLVQSIDVCDVCQSRNESDTVEEPCLHLVASAGQSRNSKNPEVWNRLGGAFHRFPLNSQKIGHIGATGKPLLVHHTKGETALSNPDWLTREGIQSFFGCPLVYNGQIGGVFAVFSRLKLTERDLRWLKQIADGGTRLIEFASKVSDGSARLHVLESENEQLRSEIAAVSSSDSLIICGPASRKLNDQIQLAAAHTKPVLITGERGSGKEFAARLVHRHSGVHADGFVKVNGHSLSLEACRSLTQIDVIALGNHVARQQVDTREHRSLRTLFIDSVDQLSAEAQGQLATVLSSASSGFARTDTSVCANQRVRIIASSTRDLQSEVAAGRFRHDLYCGLSVTGIDVPPLRQRLEDLPVLATEILNDHCRRENRDPVELDAAALDCLIDYDWPGNVRELKFVLGCALMRSRNGPILLDRYLKSDNLESNDEQAPSFVRAETMKRQERANVIACLKRCDWKVYGRGGAAELLGMKPTTLMYRMKVLEIRKPT